MRRQQRSAYKTAYNTAYNTAREYPGTIAAIIVGIGITGFLLWAARRAGGWDNLQAEAIERAREGYGRVREGYGSAREAIVERASRLTGKAEQSLE